jgi:hypothetical protein
MTKKKSGTKARDKVRAKQARAKQVRAKQVRAKQTLAAVFRGGSDLTLEALAERVDGLRKLGLSRLFTYAELKALGRLTTRLQTLRVFSATEKKPDRRETVGQR